MKPPVPCVTIGSSRVRMLCWVTATLPLSTTIIPALASPVLTTYVPGS